jgi:molecular chaperone DnaJ
MAVRQLKDYYRILEVATSAKQEDVKKAFRRLAKLYHPDINTNQYTETHFREIQEAYEVLGNTAQRRRYDEERWLNGMGDRARDQVVITPEWILRECIKLRKHMDTVDMYRMSHTALNDYIFLLLSDAHMAVLMQTDDMEYNSKIINELLIATRGLKFKYMSLISRRLAELAKTDNEMLTAIYKNLNEREKRQFWEKYLPYFVILVTLCICVLMFLWANRIKY